MENRQRLLLRFVFFFGTFLPFLRASERPIAIACLRLLTLPPFPPLPRFKLPFLRLRIALSTSFEALLEYLRAMVPPLASMQATVAAQDLRGEPLQLK